MRGLVHLRHFGAGGIGVSLREEFERPFAVGMDPLVRPLQLDEGGVAADGFVLDAVVPAAEAAGVVVGEGARALVVAVEQAGRPPGA